MEQAQQQKLWYPIYEVCRRTNAAQIPYEEFSCIVQQRMTTSNNDSAMMMTMMWSWLHSTYQSYVCLFVRVKICYLALSFIAHSIQHTSLTHTLKHTLNPSIQHTLQNIIIASNCHSTRSTIVIP